MVNCRVLLLAPLSQLFNRRDHIALVHFTDSISGGFPSGELGGCSIVTVVDFLRREMHASTRATKFCHFDGS